MGAPCVLAALGVRDPEPEAPSAAGSLVPRRFRLPGYRLRDFLGERLEVARRPLGEAEVREEARHHDAGAEVADARLRPLAVRERDRELRVTAAGGVRERERAAEARVHVRHAVRPVRLAEALDVGRTADADRLRGRAAELDQLAVGDRHALDRLAALR